MDKNYDPNARFRRLPLLPLPQNCPECSSSLGKGLKRRPMKSHWLLGAVFGVPLLCIALAFWLWPQWATSLTESGWSDLNKDKWIAPGALLFLGLIFIIRSEKVIFLACTNCSWEKEFLDKNRKVFQKDPVAQPQTEDLPEKPTGPIIEISNNDVGIAWKSGYSKFPRICPECSQELKEPRARRPRWVPYLVVAHSFYLLVGLSALSALYDSNWMNHLPENTRNLTFSIVGGLPLISGAFYRRANRVLPFECFFCGWKKDFSLKENHDFDLPE